MKGVKVMEEIKCLRCNNKMNVAKGLQLRVGEKSILLHRLPDGIEVDVYQCTNCGKLEFFSNKDDLITNIECPSCGKTHDKDYPKCPFCKYNYKV